MLFVACPLFLDRHRRAPVLPRKMDARATGREPSREPGGGEHWKARFVEASGALPITSQDEAWLAALTSRQAMR
ncbi:MAG: hypothetical protein VB138_02595 [Burkholderia sp.]